MPQPSMKMIRSLNPRPHLTRIRNWVTFHVERLLLRGTLYRLLVIGALIIAVPIIATALLVATGTPIDPSAEDTERPGYVMWWAFLRLTDPGYLGDDQGTFLRVVSTIITVIGYVLFMGALIATMTQWLHETIRNLEKGLTPIQRRNHIVVLGWTNRTPTVVREIMQSEARVQRFLLRHNAKRLSIVILAEDVRSELAIELKEELGALYNENNIIMRSGTPLRLDHLERVAFLDAASVVIPGTELGLKANFAADSRTIKTILTISNAARRANCRPPFVLAEIFDQRKADTARTAYSGGMIEILASDVVISRVITQIVRHRGLSLVFNEILTLGIGNEVLVPEVEKAAGRRFRDLESAFKRAVLLGVVRPEKNDFVPYLDPPDDFVVQKHDRLVLLARTYEDCQLQDLPATAQQEAPRARRELSQHRVRRVLILGWNHRAVALLEQFDSYSSESFSVDLLSRVAVAQREEAFDDYGFAPHHLQIRHFEGDYVVPSDIGRLELESYDSIVFLASDRYASEEESDARTIMGYLLLAEMLEKLERKPAVLVELMDAENEDLFRDRYGEIVISPLILSHIMSQVALRPELFAVFEVLLGATGPEISFESAEHYGLAGQEVGFPEIKDAVAARGQVALGIRIATQCHLPTGGILLNPINGDRWKLQAQDELVVLVTNATAE